MESILFFFVIVIIFILNPMDRLEIFKSCVCVFVCLRIVVCGTMNHTRNTHTHNTSIPKIVKKKIFLFHSYLDDQIINVLNWICGEKIFSIFVQFNYCRKRFREFVLRKKLILVHVFMRFNRNDDDVHSGFISMKQ